VLQNQLATIYIRVYGQPPAPQAEEKKTDVYESDDEEVVLFVSRNSKGSGTPTSVLMDIEIVEDANSTMAFLGLEESDEGEIEEPRGKRLVHLESLQVAPEYPQEVIGSDVVQTGQMMDEVLDWESMPGRWK
jgi:hypothetical protein